MENIQCDGSMACIAPTESAGCFSNDVATTQTQTLRQIEFIGTFKSLEMR